MGGGTFVPEAIQVQEMKKRKFKDITSPESDKYKLSGVKLHNRYEVLSNMEDESTNFVISSEDNVENKNSTRSVNSNTTVKKQKVPPIVVYSYVKGHTETLKKLQALLKNPLSIKSKNNRTILYTQTLDDYKIVKKEISESNVEYHTYSIEADKELKLVLKGLPPNVTIEEITEDLQSKNINPVKITQVKKKTPDGEILLPIRIINFLS